MRTIYLIGDSTVDDNQPPFRGWGWALPRFVREDVTVKNHALSGRSSKSFWDEKLFEPVEAEMGAGDLLLIQFGHNDEKDDAERHTDPETTYPEYLNRYIDAAVRKGAQPVLITPVARRFFAGESSVLYTHGEYPRAVRLLAEKRGIPLIELKLRSRELYLKLGQEGAAKLFVQLKPGENPDFPEGHDDKTHFNAYGADRIAALVAEEMRKIPECRDWVKPEENRMERFAWKGRIKEGMQAEYKRRHDEIWPEMLALLKSAGIRNYSIWSDGRDVFGYYECEQGIEFAEKTQAGSPIVDRWNEYMDDVLELVMDPETGAQPKLKQMFFLE